MRHYKKFFTLCVLAITSLLVIYPIYHTIYQRNVILAQITWIEYEVQPGDTIWRISRIHCPPVIQLQEWVYRIREANNIGDPGSIPIGMTLQVPVVRK